MSRDAGAVGITDAPSDGEPYIRQGGEWVHAPFGCQYEDEGLVFIPVVATASFQSFVTQNYTPDRTGLYQIVPFLSSTASSGNGKIEVRVTVTLLPSTIIVQTIVFSFTFSAAGDVENQTGHIPVPMTNAAHTIETEFRQPTSPGSITATLGGTQIWRLE